MPRRPPSLRALARALDGLPAGSITFDFSLMNSFDYYTGVVFKVYAPGLSDPVGSGGRYDAVFDGVFAGRAHVPAAGFAFSLERLEEACRLQEEARAGALAPAGDGHAAPDAAGESAGPEAQAGSGSVRPVDAAPVLLGGAGRAPLRIAVPKGSLKEGTVAVLEAAGIDASELRDPGRRLIVPARDRTPADAGGLGEVELVIVRANRRAGVRGLRRGRLRLLRT